ncbi:glycosyltransferase family 4 protein [Brevundimonas sp. DC300-4]|uniref:glycosyltransferase family 4 protein n=1 Tax=Brevundimonas sp. DC300-4 TaxID=2804594 RepID=UPI003CEAD577
MRIAVFATYDVSPGENGGEARYLALYSRLAKSHEVRVVAYHSGTGNASATEVLTPNFINVVCGISQADSQKMHSLFARTGRYLHDILCIEEYSFTDAFRAEVREAIAWADAVVISTPFLAPFISPLCKRTQLKIHESHNVEADAKASYLSVGRNPVMMARFLEQVRVAETLALCSADAVIAVSDGDAQRFADLYDVQASKLVVVPNGVTSADYDAVPPEAVEAMRGVLSSPAGVGLFIGSAYGPNIESYKQTRLWLDEAGFSGKVIVLGRMIEARDDSWPKVGFTENWLGFVDLETKLLLMRSADFALQIVTSGGGTNLKVFEYMAAGLPIIANNFGTRGIADDGWSLRADDVPELATLVTDKAWASLAGTAAATKAKAVVEREYDWDIGARRYDDVFSLAASVSTAPAPRLAPKVRRTTRAPRAQVSKAVRSV